MLCNTVQAFCVCTALEEATTQFRRRPPPGLTCLRSTGSARLAAISDSKQHVKGPFDVVQQHGRLLQCIEIHASCRFYDSGLTLADCLLRSTSLIDAQALSLFLFLSLPPSLARSLSLSLSPSLSSPSALEGGKRHPSTSPNPWTKLMYQRSSFIMSFVMSSSSIVYYSLCQPTEVFTFASGAVNFIPERSMLRSLQTSSANQVPAASNLPAAQQGLVHNCLLHKRAPTLDKRNPAPVDKWCISLFVGFQPSKVVQDFFHPQYHS